MPSNPYESPRTKNPKPRLSGLPARLLLIVLGNAVFIGAAVSLLVVAEGFHDEYAKAHQAAYQGARVSPEPFFKRAGYAASSIGLVCVLALIGAFWTKHPISFATLIICVAIWVYALQQVGVRY